MDNLPLINLFRHLDRFTHISARWYGILTLWVMRSDGFTATLDLKTFKTDIDLVVQELCVTLASLQASISDEELVDLLSKECGILFMWAQYQTDFWNSTEESFLNFWRRHRTQSTPIPNQQFFDKPHLAAPEVRSYLLSLLA